MNNASIIRFCTKAACALILLACLLPLVGCVDTMAILDGADYVCIDGQIDGPYTDSGAVGRGIKLPEGETLTPETIEALCP